MNILSEVRAVDLSRYDAVNAERPSSKTSDRYLFIPTTKAIDAIVSRGWVPVQASQARTRIEANEGFQKHVVRFRQSSVTPLKAVIGEIYPELILTNSHSGTSAFCVKFGLWRVVCCNGMCVSDSSFETLRVLHKGFSNIAITNAVGELTSSIPAITERVQEFQAIDLTPNEKGIFVNAALHVRYGKEALQTRQFDTSSILRPRRSADNRDDLFTTMNIVQEKLIRGGERLENKIDKRGYLKRVKVRAVNSVNENLRINQALWMLTEHMATLKKTA
jgi:hypothetical protein